MNYEKQKAACASYAQRNGGSVADVLRTSGRRGAVVVSKDGRPVFDPFVIEPIAELLTGTPEVKNPDPVIENPVAEKPAAPKKKTTPKKK